MLGKGRWVQFASGPQVPLIRQVRVDAVREDRRAGQSEVNHRAGVGRPLEPPHRGAPRGPLLQGIGYYENQREEEALAEDEAAYEDPKQTVMVIPNELVAAVRELLAKRGV